MFLLASLPFFSLFLVDFDCFSFEFEKNLVLTTVELLVLVGLNIIFAYN